MRALLVPIALGAFGVGLGRTLARIASHLTEAGWSVTVLTSRPLDVAAIERRFGVSLGEIAFEIWPSRPEARKGRIRRFFYDRWRHLGLIRLSRRFDLVWMQSPYIPPVSLARRSILFTEFPFEAAPRALLWRRRLRSYCRVVANSRFTRGWITRRWGIEAGVFYPSIQESVPLPKEPWILAVGRFTGGSRSKNQLALVRAYRGMVEGGLEGWPLHLAGIVEDRAYFEAVQREADGLPVRLHTDLDAAGLRDLYGRSSIFWHAAGLGIDPEREPQALEHFGIVTAEAMSAGCVPLVVGRGGQCEIVRDGEGFTWQEPADLQRRTWALVNEPQKRGEISARARASVLERFGDAAFVARLEALVTG